MTALLTGFAAVDAIHEADRLYFRGLVEARNALLLTVDPAWWNGREILPVEMLDPAVYAVDEEGMPR